MRKQKTERELQNIVDDFNLKFPVGTQVVLKKDTEVVQTVVESPAEILGGHSAVGWFRGVRGCYAIEGRVTEVSK